MAASETPDLILMDVALGEMDGWEATQLIKRNPATAAIPIIALTAHALASDRDKSVEVGCCDFDTKPVDLQRLLSKMRACLPLESDALSQRVIGRSAKAAARAPFRVKNNAANSELDPVRSARSPHW